MVLLFIGGSMPSRIERYYNSEDKGNSRASKNEELYRTIYDEVEYTNVEGISIIEKNENIDIDKIKELINEEKNNIREMVAPTPSTNEIEELEIEEKNYDIREVLATAKSERVEMDPKQPEADHIEDNYIEEKTLNEEELKNMIDTITSNSKVGHTSDLLDDLKTKVDEDFKEEKIEIEEEKQIDNIFLTSSIDLNTADFEDLKDNIKENVKGNKKTAKTILFILLSIVIVGMGAFIYFFVMN